MAVKNFVFRENWVGSKVAGMKTIFFATFDLTWTHILAPKGSMRNSLKSILVRKNRNYVIINFVALKLTKVKFLKIISLLPFLTQLVQKFGPKSASNVVFLAILALNFNSSVCTTTTFCFKRYSPCKI